MAQLTHNFIPEVWNAELLVTLQKSLVYGAPGVVNRDYEGDIREKGDTVRITNLVDPAIGDYNPATDITVGTVTDDQQSLLIDQAKYFAFEVNDVQARQSAGNVLDPQAQRAAYLLRDAADQFIAGKMATEMTAGNIKAEATYTKDTAYEAHVDLSVMLDEQNVPSEGRWVVVTPKFHGLLLKDSRFVSAGDAMGATTRANGVVGEAAGFSVRKSNNAPAGPGVGAGRLIIAGYGGATTFAEQIVKTESARKEKGFADIVKGLHVYGSKVVRPSALAALDAIV